MTQNKIIVILRDTKTLIYVYILFAFSLAFPSVLIVQAVAAALTIIISIIHLNRHPNMKCEILDRLYLFSGFALLFLLSIAGILNSNNLQNSIDLVIRQLPLLLFPILILKLRVKDYLMVIKAFIYGIFCYFLWVLIYDSYYLLTRHSIRTIDINYLRYISSVRLPYLIHWNYLGMFVNFGVISSLFILKPSKVTISFVIISVLLSPIILGKLSFLILLFIIGFYTIHKVYSLNNNLKYLLIPGSVIIILFLAYFSIELKDGILTSYESRIVLWKASVEIWAQNPIFGHGTNSVQAVMHSYLSNNNIIVPGLDGDFLDAHNIFAQALISHGLIGLVALIFFFGKGYWAGKNNIALILLLTLILLTGQVEHIFQRQWGILFVSFFIPLLTINNKQLI